jgi:hypothetical protein
LRRENEEIVTRRVEENLRYRFRFRLDTYNPRVRGALDTARRNALQSADLLRNIRCLLRRVEGGLRSPLRVGVKMTAGWAAYGVCRGFPERAGQRGKDGVCFRLVMSARRRFRGVQSHP